MKIASYLLIAIGAAAIVCSGALLAPAASLVASKDDILPLLGMPMAANGITLLVSGAIAVAVGLVTRAVADLPRMRTELAALQESVRALAGPGGAAVREPVNMQMKCPQCEQQLRVAIGKKGTIKCPKCSWSCEAQVGIAA